MDTFQVWSEGFLTAGMGGIPEKAAFHGEFYAANFRKACIMASRKYEWGEQFDLDRLTYFGCRLFDNEHDARESFG